MLFKFKHLYRDTLNGDLPKKMLKFIDLTLI